MENLNKIYVFIKRGDEFGMILVFFFVCVLNQTSFLMFCFEHFDNFSLQITRHQIVCTWSTSHDGSITVVTYLLTGL